jgi:5'-nucleotidase
MMFPQPIDLAKARILISNDDGIAAPGLKVLERVARSISSDVWVVAPETEQSGAGHSLTLRLPLRIRALGRKRFAVDGTPTDCVLLAIREIMAKRKPDLILSGINHGGNMGEDLTYSGTVAAAMEGTLMEVPSFAFSLTVTHGEKAEWATAADWAGPVIRKLVTAPWPANTLMNVNIPNIPSAEVTGIRAARQGRRKIGDNLVSGTDPRGRRYFWIGPTRDEDAARVGTDLHGIAAGAVTVTPIFLDLTHVAALENLRRIFP